VTHLPLTVIGGYLGAGKTTLINRLLTGDHGKRLMIMVNDFGAVNIDAALLANASDDTLELTNGCVCCTMGADLFMAVGDVLDRPVWPDHLIIEASGIADPAKIAQVAQTEPELSYAGIVTVVDALNAEVLLADPQIAPQIQSQFDVADLIYVSKGDLPASLQSRLAQSGSVPVLTQNADIAPLLWDLQPGAPVSTPGHAHFVHWSADASQVMQRDALIATLKRRPEALYRVKGFVAAPKGAWLVQVVGQVVEVTSVDTAPQTSLVGIAVAGSLDTNSIDQWWHSAPLD